MKPEFSKQIFEKSSNFNVHKIHTAGSKKFHADGCTDKKKVIVAFRNFANAPKNRVLKLNRDFTH